MKAYLIFQINNELFALPSDDVLKVAKDFKMTKIPLSDKYVKGMVQYLDDYIYVYDAKKKLFKIDSTEYYHIICNYDNKKIAITVDNVSVIEDIDINNIKHSSLYNEYVDGYINTNDNKYIMILNLKKLIS